ncbi:MAG: D-alanine--D-alanine ligase [Elusimicrobiota bacterium]
MSESSLKGFGRVAVLTGGESAEKEVAYSTARSIEKALTELGVEFGTVQAEGDFVKVLASGNYDMVFIAMHGGKGENGSIQGLLDTLDIPYTGSGVLASAVCMNKVFSKKIFKYHNIPSPGWQLMESADSLEIDVPLVVKPVMGGSTIATTIVRDKEGVPEAFEKARISSEQSGCENDGVMAEEYIPGREITVGVLNGRALPLLEIESMTDFYDYTAKYQIGMSKHYPVEDIAAGLYDDIQAAAELAFRVTGCSTMARVDFRLDGKNFYILEINTIPGMTETSLLPEAAELAGIDFNTLVKGILESTSAKK